MAECYYQLTGRDVPLPHGGQNLARELAAIRTFEIAIDQQPDFSISATLERRDRESQWFRWDRNAPSPSRLKAPRRSWLYPGRPDDRGRRNQHTHACRDIQPPQSRRSLS